MKQSFKTDKICIEKILRYISQMRHIYELSGVSSPDELEDDFACHLAMTQLITNIHEMTVKIQSETLAKVPSFSMLKPRIRAARNIASHDYEGVDFSILFKLINQLLRRSVTNELKEASHDIPGNN